MIDSTISHNISSEKYIQFEEDEDDGISIINDMEDKGDIERPYLITKELILESNGNILNFNIPRHSMFSIGSLVLKWLSHYMIDINIYQITSVNNNISLYTVILSFLLKILEKTNNEWWYSLKLFYVYNHVILVPVILPILITPSPW